jgi:hypothetical protein
MRPELADGIAVGPEALKIITGESELYNRVEVPVTESHDFDTRARAENRYRMLGWTPRYLDANGKKSLVSRESLAIVANQLTALTSKSVPEEATSGNPEWCNAPAFMDENGVVTFLWRGVGCAENIEAEVGPFTVKGFGVSIPGFESTLRYLVVPPSNSLRWLQGREPKRPETLLQLPASIRRELERLQSEKTA